MQKPNWTLSIAPWVAVLWLIAYLTGCPDGTGQETAPSDTKEPPPKPNKVKQTESTPITAKDKEEDPSVEDLLRLIGSAFFTPRVPGEVRPTMVFDQTRVASWPINELRPWISADGVVLSNVNETPMEVRFSREGLLSDLSARKGRVHLTFAHLGYTLTERFEWVSSARRVQEGPNRILLEVGKPPRYQVEFSRAEGQIYLIRISYLRYEVD